MTKSEEYAEINLYFEFHANAGLEEAAREIEDRLGKLEAVDEVEAMPTNPRITGAEIVAAIAVTAMVVRGGRDAVAEIRKLVTEVKGLIGDLRDLKNAYVDVGRKRIPIDKLDAHELQALSKGA
jgi:hypothetical protein